jgi:hypothetical protein
MENNRKVCPIPMWRRAEVNKNGNVALGHITYHHGLWHCYREVNWAISLSRVSYPVYTIGRA